MPSMPGTFDVLEPVGSVSSERQLAGVGDSSRIARPAHTTLRASTSSRLTPTFPICGAVITTICPAYDGSLTISW